MDRLLTLQARFSPEAEAQAKIVCELMDKAHKERADHVMFSAAGAMHPRVMQVLVSKGYDVQELQNQTLGYSPQNVKAYKIT